MLPRSAALSQCALCRNATYSMPSSAACRRNAGVEHRGRPDRILNQSDRLIRPRGRAVVALSRYHHYHSTDPKPAAATDHPQRLSAPRRIHVVSRKNHRARAHRWRWHSQGCRQSFAACRQSHLRAAMSQIASPRPFEKLDSAPPPLTAAAHQVFAVVDIIDPSEGERAMAGSW